MIDINALEHFIMTKINALQYYDQKTAEDLLKEYQKDPRLSKLIDLNEILHIFIELYEITLPTKAS